ncbi:hypothetical protein Glove_66g68 [Diversispora epigaea]|uniref:Uncharacterized protein n=1 Tax=Diversispora epigaea TaxID=1348612 RepID=A0A397JLE9_9GLOM|nr:hypothetical protein Glove_66g68 [Diversispora epigaea]
MENASSMMKNGNANPSGDPTYTYLCRFSVNLLATRVCRITEANIKDCLAMETCLFAVQPLHLKVVAETRTAMLIDFKAQANNSQFDKTVQTLKMFYLFHNLPTEFAAFDELLLSELPEISNLGLGKGLGFRVRERVFFRMGRQYRDSNKGGYGPVEAISLIKSNNSIKIATQNICDLLNPTKQIQ